MQRREFLRLGGVGGLGSLAVWMSRPGDALALTGEPQARLAYAEHWGARAIDARRLASGDPALAKAGLRISVFGLAPGAGESPLAPQRLGSGRVELDVVFPLTLAPGRSLDPMESGDASGGPADVARESSPPVFHAWSSQAGDFTGAGGSSASSCSQSCSFVVPVDAEGGLRLLATWNETAVPIALSTGAREGLPKLKSGIYRISPPSGSLRGLACADGTCPELVLTVDAATAEARTMEPWRIEHG